MGFSLRLERFCCCCSLKTGSLIIGTAGWIITLLELFAMLDPVTKNYSQQQQQQQQQQQPSLMDEDDELEMILKEQSSNNLIYQIGYSIVSFIICVLLIWGIYKKDNRFMLPWLVLKCLEAILTTVVTIIVLILACFVPASATGVLIIIFIVILLLTVLSWYTWLCVWSHYKELGENVQVPAIHYSPNAAAPPPAYEKGYQAP